MAKPRFLLQGVRKDNDHESALKDLFGLENLSEIILSVAFVRENGVTPIADSLKKKAPKVLVIAGIRNGTTSAQGLLALLECKVNLIGIDTGTISPIFHPKIYLATTTSSACVIVGSANLTYSGLNENIEASTVIDLNRANPDDEEFLQDILKAFKILQTNYPEHVIKISRKRDVSALLKEGRLEDERYVSQQMVSRLHGRKKRDSLKRIRLHIKPHAPLMTAKPTHKLPRSRRSEPDTLELGWVSKELTERDLNIPSGKNTNPTGSMLFTKGRMKDIDQRSFFRNTVFSELSWKKDARKQLSHLERSEAEFEIVVKGISYGIYKLKLTHNTRTDSRAYEQNNAMTGIHWGEAKEIIAQRDLLGRELKLFRKIGKHNSFVIEID